MKSTGDLTKMVQESSAPKDSPIQNKKLRRALFIQATLLIAIASARNASAQDEFNFSWLDPEKKIYVLQNRKHLKANRPLLSLMAGPGLSPSYRNRFSIEPRLAYYVSEAFGIEAFYTTSFNTENSTYKGLVGTNTTVLPMIREISGQLGALAHWVPWYAKINVFNKILYFDWYFSGGLGSVRTVLDTRANANAPANLVNEDKMGLFVGTGHQYYVTEQFIVRLDFMGTFYSAPLLGTTGENTWFSEYNFGFGVGLRL